MIQGGTGKVGVRVGMATVFAILGVWGLASAASAESPVRAVEVVAGRLNVRASPSGATLGSVPRGRRLVVASENSGWLAVDFDGRRGWIAAGYTRPVSSGFAEEVKTSVLNVRSGPGSGYAIVGTARAGQRYVRSGTSGAWRRIDFGDSQRWVHGSYTRSLPIGSGSSTPPSPPPPVSGWSAIHVGLQFQGSQIPRAGVPNETLRRSLGVDPEPYGRVVQISGRSFAQGKVSSFGGPKDTGVTSTETGAVTGERLRSLNTPLDADAATIASRPGDFYFCAMRWDYSQDGRSFWREARLLVVNPRTGKAVVVRPVDWGPHTRTARTLDLSPQTLRDLGLGTDQEAAVAFATPGAPLGVVR